MTVCGRLRCCYGSRPAQALLSVSRQDSWFYLTPPDHASPEAVSKHTMPAVTAQVHDTWASFSFDRLRRALKESRLGYWPVMALFIPIHWFTA